MSLKDMFVVIVISIVAGFGMLGCNVAHGDEALVSQTNGEEIAMANIQNDVQAPIDVSVLEQPLITADASPETNSVLKIDLTISQEPDDLKVEGLN